ncbi:hypothetical protein QBC39DRAFT_348485 [Podospora conica]|nr:hypothetical protein QBC39DRAFT_348485 [Schizothecium conicum]
MGDSRFSPNSFFLHPNPTQCLPALLLPSNPFSMMPSPQHSLFGLQGKTGDRLPMLADECGLAEPVTGSGLAGPILIRSSPGIRPAVFRFPTPPRTQTRCWVPKPILGAAPLQRRPLPVEDGIHPSYCRHVAREFVSLHSESCLVLGGSLFFVVFFSARSSITLIVPPGLARWLQTGRAGLSAWASRRGLVGPGGGVYRMGGAPWSS